MEILQSAHQFTRGVRIGPTEIKLNEELRHQMLSRTRKTSERRRLVGSTRGKIPHDTNDIFGNAPAIVTRRACAASRSKISKLLSDRCRLMAHVLRVLSTYIIIELPGVGQRNGFIIGPFCRFCHALPYYMSFDSWRKCLIICFWQLMKMPYHMFLTVDEYALSYVFWQLLKMVHRRNRSNLNQLINLICRKFNLHFDYRASFLIFVD